MDKLFWVLARRFWADWKKSLLVVTPETVVRWHRAGFRLYWSLISRVKKQVGRKRLSKEIWNLIFRMVAENPTWGAPHIHGELLMLGFHVSERSISSWMKRAPRDPELARRWRPLFAIIATRLPPWISSLSRQSRSICCTASFIISHQRRQILHVNVTRHPTSTWIAQQLREAVPYESAPRFLLFDRDQKYGLEVPAALRSLQITALQTSIRSPWQNGVAERWVGSCPARSARPHHCLEQAPPQAASRRVHVLLSQRPHASWPPQGNSWPQNPFCSHRSGGLLCAIGRFAPSLRPRGLTSVDFHWLTHPETSATSSPSNKEPSLRVSICTLGLNPSRVGKLSSGSTSRCTLDFGELQGAG